ncbi:MAG: Maf family protein, partial [Saprospiraceae bacterium]
MDVLKRKIILASKSPRRSHLLREAGFDFEIKTREVDESYPTTLPVGEVAAYLAEKKALACKNYLQGSEVLLAADSVVILDNIIYGKPKNPEDACRILRQLSGKV